MAKKVREPTARPGLPEARDSPKLSFGTARCKLTRRVFRSLSTHPNRAQISPYHLDIASRIVLNRLVRAPFVTV